MNTKRNRKFRRKASIAGIFILTFLFVGDAWADRHAGEFAHRLPRGYQRLHFGREDYFYHGGTYYHRGPRGFFVVRPPVGLVVAFLPFGFKTIIIRGATYYFYDEVYYQRAPSGYVVIQEPPVIVKQDPSRTGKRPSEQQKQLVVTAERLNVRSGPSLDSPVVAEVLKGATLVTQGSAEGWWYVQIPDGIAGWVMSQYTAELQEPQASG
jgi:hypothetical protein